MLLRDQQKQLQYLKETKYFKDLTISTLTKMAYNMKKVNFIKNQIIYKDKDAVDGIYIVLDGRVKYTKITEFKTRI